MSLSTASSPDVRIFSPLVFLLLFGVLEGLLPRFCKRSLLNSPVKLQTGDRRASSPLAALVVFPPGVLLPFRGLQRPFLLLGGQVLCSKGRMLQPKSLKASTVGWLLFRAVFCRFFISSKLMTLSSLRKASSEVEVLHFPWQPVREIERPLRAR